MTHSSLERSKVIPASQTKFEVDKDPFSCDESLTHFARIEEPESSGGMTYGGRGGNPLEALGVAETSRRYWNSKRKRKR